MSSDPLELFRGLAVATVTANPGATCSYVALSLALDQGDAGALLGRLCVAGTLSESEGRYYLGSGKPRVAVAPPVTKVEESKRVVHRGRKVDVVYHRR